MALPDLLAALRRQAAERRAAELADADARAARIAEESIAGLERRRSDFVAKARREEERVAHRALSRAEREAAESVLLARDRLLGRVRSALERRITGAESDPIYLDILAKELRAALERLPNESVVVRTRPGLARRVGASLGAGDRVRLETATDVGTGFTALAPDARVEIDATLETRLVHAWPRLAVAVLAELAR